MTQKNNLHTAIARDEMNKTEFDEMIATGMAEAQGLPNFKSNLTIHEVERSFDSIDVFLDLRDRLEEALTYSKRREG